MQNYHKSQYRKDVLIIRMSSLCSSDRDTFGNINDSRLFRAKEGTVDNTKLLNVYQNNNNTKPLKKQRIDIIHYLYKLWRRE